MHEVQNPAAMRDVWCWGLSWFRKPPTVPDKRAKQATLIDAILRELRATDTVPALHERYCDDSRWCLKIARDLFPQEWPALGVHVTTAAAYGLRHVEILTGKALDPTAPLPRWIGEWSIW